MRTPAEADGKAVSARTGPAVGLPRPEAAGLLPNAESEPLPHALRSYFDPRFGHDFSKVRVHHDARAAESAARLGARAYTAGHDIVFARDQYAPHRPAGRGLLAHELAHVVQASLGTVAGAHEFTGRHDALEAEADRAAARVASGLPSGPIQTPNADIALTSTSEAVEPLVSHSLTDWVVTEADQRAVLAQIQADPDLSATVADLESAGMLELLLRRVDEPPVRREMLQLFGAGLDPSARGVIEPRIAALGIEWELQYHLGRLGVSSAAAPFNRAAYASVVGSGPSTPFSGSGATGVSPTAGDIPWADRARLGAGSSSTTAAYSNPVDSFPGNLFGYLASLTPAQRARQAELLTRQPISTAEPDSYAGAIPSRADVMRSAASAQNLHPQIIGAILLAEQRDQSANEDAADYLAATTPLVHHPSSIGLGQVTITTAGRRDLFADLLSSGTRGGLPSDPDQTARLLASDEFNIFAVARYIRWVADQGAAMAPGALPNTLAAFPGLDLPRYAVNSATWPEDNIGALGMYYTSRPWTDDMRSVGWGCFVVEAYRDVVASGVF